MLICCGCYVSPTFANDKLQLKDKNMWKNGGSKTSCMTTKRLLWTSFLSHSKGFFERKNAVEKHDIGRKVCDISLFQIQIRCSLVNKRLREVEKALMWCQQVNNNKKLRFWRKRK